MKISNVQFIATLLHLKPNSLTYSEVLSMLHYWRGQPLNVPRFNWVNDSYIQTRVARNTWGTQYLSYAPDRGGIYKRVIWDSTNRLYHLLPSGNAYVVPAKNVEELLAKYQFKGC